MKGLFALLVLLCGACAAFDAPTISIGQSCASPELAATMRELNDPDFVARINAARPGEPR